MANHFSDNESKHNTTPPDATANAHSPAILSAEGIKQSRRPAGAMLQLMWGATEQGNRVVLPNLSRTGHLRGLDSFPDIVPVTHGEVAAYKLLPTTPSPSLKYLSQKYKD